MPDTPQLHRPTWIIASLLSLASLHACGTPQTPSIPAPDLPQSAPDLTRPSVLPAEESDPWREIKITSDYAEIKIDPSGHYSISRNNCWVAGYGAITLTDWQPLELAMQEVTLRSRRLNEEETCFAESTGPRSLRGPVEIQLETGPKLDLVTYNYPNLLCTKHANRAAVERLARALDPILPKTFAEDCTLPGPVL